MESWIIEKIKEKEKDSQVQIPLFYYEDMPLPPDSESPSQEPERGVVVIDYSGGNGSMG